MFPDQCIPILDIVFEAMDLLMLVCFLVGLFLGWLAHDLSYTSGNEDRKPLNFKEKSDSL